MLGPVTAEFSALVDDICARGPSEVRRDAGGLSYAEVIAAAALSQSRSDSPVSAARLAWLLVAVGTRESLLGTSADLDSQGPGCTGDFTARLLTPKRTDLRHKVIADARLLPLRWHPPRDDRGRLIPGPYAIPMDGRGYGRSEWQHDYDAHPDVTDATDGSPLWQNSQWACERAAARLLSDWAVLGGERQTLAAYNCGVGGVRHSLAAGDDVDARTTGGEYSLWIGKRLIEWGQVAPWVP